VLSRTLLETEVDAGGSAITLFATHLSPVLEAEGNSRLTEAKAVLGVLASGFDRPHLLAGDFNALHPEDTFGIPPPREADARHTAPAAARQVIRLFLEAGYRDCYRSLHPRAAGYTYASDCPWARIDFIFASPEMAPHLRGCDIVTGEDAKRASDHFPIWAEFA
jgi:endonuclease/exonuclease/phosphatase family metal-dependent hydrolase